MKTILLVATAALICAVQFAVAADAPSALKAGDKAPLVEGKDQDGKTWKLADDIGKQALLLYFYPKDETPGCTKQACSMRDSITELEQSKVKVVGVSFDSAESHQKFIAKHGLNFPLIADTDGKIAEAYGVKMKDRNMARRVSFLIGRDGKIAHVTDSGDPEKHVTEMKLAAATLKKS